VKLAIVAEYNPAFLTDDGEPFVVGHIILEALVIVPLNHDWSTQRKECAREPLAEIPIEVER